jgi:hypothetical protein
MGGQQHPLDDLRMKHKTAQTTVLIQYSTTKVIFGNYNIQMSLTGESLPSGTADETV